MLTISFFFFPKSYRVVQKLVKTTIGYNALCNQLPNITKLVIAYALINF